MIDFLTFVIAIFSVFALGFMLGKDSR